MNILELGFRIKQAIGLTGYSVKEFCSRTNRSRVTTAIWIAGRGGMIKDSSLIELCMDLKKCNVLCDINWIKFGIGTAPTLIPESQIPPKITTTLNTLDINLVEVEEILKSLDNNKYFTFSNKKYIVIGAKTSLDNLSKSSNHTITILTKTHENITGLLTGFCKTTNTLVVTDFTNKLRCIATNNIDKAGYIVFLLNKN